MDVGTSRSQGEVEWLYIWAVKLRLWRQAGEEGSVHTGGRITRENRKEKFIDP